MDNKNLFMQKAIQLATQNIQNGGGPFGAIITKNNRIIATGVNQVTKNNDPTAHAEVNAIRKACQQLQTFNLKGCEIYTTCEPCPMCLAAIYWAHIDKIYYACNKNDAAKAGFDDSHIYKQLKLPIKQRQITMQNIQKQQAQQIFNLWNDTPNKTKY